MMTDSPAAQTGAQRHVRSWPHVEQLPFLSIEECDRIVEIADAHPEIAVDRRPDDPGCFVTYGRSAYLDILLEGADPEQNYYASLGAANRMLLEAFGDFYERLRNHLSGLLGEPVRYDPESLALPGLHIFRGHTIALADEASAHFDLQFNNLRLPGPLDPGHLPLTVTVPVRIPVNGTGLVVYDVDIDRFNAAYRRGAARSMESYAQRRTRAYHPYETGNLVLHRGLLMHQLSSPGPVVPGDQRITVQGHGVRIGGEWILYW